MKKIFTIIVLATMTLTAMAQSEIKRVAILEIVDKMGTVPYMKRLVFRSNLTTAVSNTIGYEGYDRVDLNQVLGEQNFQRTGLVSDEDIKKIGDFTGAKYVIVAEAVIDGEEMFITAKITDVETARVIRNSNQLMGISTAEMKIGSEKVAEELLSPNVYEKSAMEASLQEKERQKQEAIILKRDNLMRLNEYVDLGLPSQTLWYSKNEIGFFTYEEAVNKYGNQIPSYEQLSELEMYCTWTWAENGYIVTGKNGNAIFLPALGYRECGGKIVYVYKNAHYWSRTPISDRSAHCLFFNDHKIFIENDNYSYKCWGNSVRLVK